MTEENINIEILEERPDHHYRTELPNIVFSVLTAIQLAVYAHLKRIAGDRGKCWMSIKNIAEQIGVGETTLRESIRELCKSNVLIGSPFIRITKRKRPDGADDTSLITIVDIWRANGDFYRKVQSQKPAQKSTEKPEEGAASKSDGGGGSPDEGGGFARRRGRVRQTNPKKNPLKKNNVLFVENRGLLPLPRLGNQRKP